MVALLVPRPEEVGGTTGLSSESRGQPSPRSPREPTGGRAAKPNTAAGLGGHGHQFVDDVLRNRKEELREPADVDFALGRLELSVTALLWSGEASMVAQQRCDKEVVRHLQTMRTYLAQCLATPDRTLLIQVFGGDCVRIARFRAFCETILDTSAPTDTRAKVAREALTQVDCIERVLVDHGLGDRLARAKAEEVEEAGASEEPDSPSAADDAENVVIQDLATATVAGSEAQTCEAEGRVEEALERYRECQSAVGRALESMRAGAVAEGSEEGLQTLETHKQQVDERIRHLEVHGCSAEVPPGAGEFDSQRPLQFMQRWDKRRRLKVILACAAVGAAAGVAITGPLGCLLLAAGGAFGGGGVAAAAVMHGGAIGDKLYDIGERGLEVGEQAAGRAKIAATVAAEQAATYLEPQVRRAQTVAAITADRAATYAEQQAGRAQIAANIVADRAANYAEQHADGMRHWVCNATRQTAKNLVKMKTQATAKALQLNVEDVKRT